MCTLHGSFKVTVIYYCDKCENIQIFIWRNLFGVIVLNQNNSKDLFDFSMSFQRVFSVL